MLDFNKTILVVKQKEYIDTLAYSVSESFSNLNYIDRIIKYSDNLDNNTLLVLNKLYENDASTYFMLIKGAKNSTAKLNNLIINEICRYYWYFKNNMLNLSNKNNMDLEIVINSLKPVGYIYTFTLWCLSNYGFIPCIVNLDISEASIIDTLKEMIKSE